MSDMFGNGSSGSIDMLVDISPASIPQQTISIDFVNDELVFKDVSK